MKNHFVNQDKLNLFTKIISDKIQNGFVVVERNDKLPGRLKNLTQFLRQK